MTNADDIEVYMPKSENPKTALDLNTTIEIFDYYSQGDTRGAQFNFKPVSFDGASVRHTSSRLGLVSESSSRFVKGTNHFQAEEVINFASYLIKEYCEAKDFSNIVNYSTEKNVERNVERSALSIIWYFRCT